MTKEAPAESRVGGVMLLLASRFGMLALQVVSLPLVVRILGDKQYALAVILINLRMLWQILDFEMPQALMQVLSGKFRVDAPLAWRYFRTGLASQFGVGLIGLITISLVIPAAVDRLPGDNRAIVGHPQLPLMCLITGLQYLSDTVGSTYNIPFLAREQFKRLATLTSIIPALGVIVSLTFVWVLKSPVGLLLGGLAESLLMFVIRIGYIRKNDKEFPITPAFNFGLYKDLIGIGMKTFVSGISTKIGGSADKLIVGAVLGEALAVYNLACRIPQLMLDAFVRLSEAITPEMTHHARNEPERFPSTFKRNLGIVCLVGVSAIMIVSAFGQPLFQAWFRKEAPGIGIVVLLMGIYYTLEMHFSTITRGFFAFGKPHYMLPFTLWNSLITLTCTAFFARKFGLIGVAAMNLGIDVCQFLPIHWYATRHIVPGERTWNLVKIGLPLIGLGILLSALVAFAFRDIQLGAPSYWVLLAVPPMVLLFAATAIRWELAKLPEKLVVKVNQRLPILGKLLGFHPDVP